MPKESVTFDVATTPSATLESARRLVAERGWSQESLTAGRLVARRGWRATAWPITVELLFAGAEAGTGTQVTANGKIGGLGPLQRRALVGAMDELRRSIEFEATAPAHAASV